MIFCHCEEDDLPDEAISVTVQEITHLHCNTPALVGGARERSAAQVSGKEQKRPRNDMVIFLLQTPMHSPIHTPTHTKLNYGLKPQGLAGNFQMHFHPP
jgi:hypothetical protein